MTPLEFVVHHPVAATCVVAVLVAGAAAAMEWVKIGLESWQESLEAKHYRRTLGRDSYTKADLARLLAAAGAPTRQRVAR